MDLKKVEQFSVESIGDIAYNMEHQDKLRKVRRNMIVPGVMIDIIQWVTIFIWIFKGIWQPFAIATVFEVAMAIWISKYYFERVSYICPNCHKVFRPNFKEAFWAKHTPTTRKLTCVECGYKGFCAETYNNELEEI